MAKQKVETREYTAVCMAVETLPCTNMGNPRRRVFLMELNTERTRLPRSCTWAWAWDTAPNADCLPRTSNGNALENWRVGGVYQVTVHHTPRGKAILDSAKSMDMTVSVVLD